MRARFTTLLAVLWTAVAALLTAGVQLAHAGLVATTGQATSVTSASAILNGVALTLNPSSRWLFQYGTSASYGRYSQGSSVGVGLTAVSATVTDLSPATTYHFRLVVIQGDPGRPNDYSTGDDVTFTTAPAAPRYGTASVESHRLAVSGGATSIRVRCAGPPGALCKGIVRLVAHRARGGLVDCGTGVLSAGGGRRNSVLTRVDRACAALLRRARGHAVRGELRLALDGGQRLLTTAVTLVAGAA